MSKTSISITLVVYLVAASVVAGFETQMVHPGYGGGDLVGNAVGGGLTIFVVGGVLPLIVWAFMRFRADRAAIPLVLWAILSCAMAGFSYLGNKVDRDHKLSEDASPARPSRLD